jgi:endoglucanase
MVAAKVLSRREFGAIAACGCASLCSWCSPQSNSASLDKPKIVHRGGVSLAGAEFGSDKPNFSNANPGIYGQDYTYPDRRTIEYFAACGLGLLRLPFRWERLQPQLGQSLDAAELKRIGQVIAWAADCGAVVILDTHNYGRYRMSLFGRPRSVVIDEKIDGTVAVSREHFADYWRRIAEAFADPVVVGLGLMNEPHDMGHSEWKRISQSAVEAIRTVNRESYMVVAGGDWSSAQRFPESNGPNTWITDPADRVLYEAHCYFDADGSGKYRRSYADELRDDPQLPERGVKRVGVFLDWCSRNQVAGFLGEFGIPGDNPLWREVLINMLRSLRQTETPACYWAAGSWWHDYPLSVQPRDDFRQPAPQLDVLRRWLAPSTES